MSEFDLNHVEPIYIDVLTELGNIGAGNAATSLAQMLNTQVKMTVPKVELLDFDKIGEAMGGEEQIMAGIYLLVEGDITGSIMFLLDERSAHLLTSKLMGTTPTEGELSEMEASALKEIGNIVTGAYLNSLAAITNLTITESIPDLTIDMAGAIPSVPAIQFGMVGDKILFIQTGFTGDEELNAFFLLVPDLPSYDKLLKALGVIQ